MSENLWHQIVKMFTCIMAWLFSPKNQPTEPIWATFLKGSIQNGNFLEKTVFHLLCGFHTNENGEPLKPDPNLTQQFHDMLADLHTEIQKVPHMNYEISSKIILETEETGMHILTLFQAFQYNQIILLWH